MNVEHLADDELPDPAWRKMTLGEIAHAHRAALAAKRAEQHANVDRLFDEFARRLEGELLELEREMVLTGGGHMQ